jgi:hypothetical protein
MKRLLFIIFTSFFFIASCAKKKPEGILSESQAVDLFTEVSLIDAYINTLSIDSGRKVIPVLYGKLFKEYKLDSVSFVKNLNYYYGNPKLTENIYSEVHKKLTKYDQVYHVEDSIRGALQNDSIIKAARLHCLDCESLNITLNQTKNELDFSFQDNGLEFFRRANMHLNAYGIQTPAIQTSVSSPPVVPVEQNKPSQDTAMSLYDEVPLEPIKDTIIKKEMPRKLKILQQNK